MIRRGKMYIATVIMIVIITIAFAVFASGPDEINIEFLKSYGWQVGEHYIECRDVIIPKPFDLVYENYNALQAEAGLDLTEYMGRRAKRYTYIVENYPEDTGEPVRADVICVNGKPVAGDIMTVSAGGFMKSLGQRSTEPADGD